jgi:hypothetical protein
MVTEPRASANGATVAQELVANKCVGLSGLKGISPSLTVALRHTATKSAGPLGRGVTPAEAENTGVTNRRLKAGLRTVKHLFCAGMLPAEGCGHYKSK